MATLTYVYTDSTAVVGPLATTQEPHTYDLCEDHGRKLTAPRGWDLVRHVDDNHDPMPSGDDLVALADAVREAARAKPEPAVETPPPAPRRPGAERPVGERPGAGRPHLRVVPGDGADPEGVEPQARG